MMKKTTLALLTASMLSSTAFAEKSAFDGLYAGIKVGTESPSFNIQETNGTYYFDRALDNKLQFSGDLFLGYRQMIDALCVGLEVNGKLSSEKGELNSNYGGGGGIKQSVAIKRKGALGIHALFGGLVNPNTLAYIKLGGEYSYYNYHYSNANDTAARNTNKDNSPKKFNFVVGIGTDIALADYMALRLEASITPRAKLHSSKNGDNRVETKVHHHSFGVGLVYTIPVK